MMRKLLLVMIVLAVGTVLISPSVDGDEAIHRHGDHHAQMTAAHRTSVVFSTAEISFDVGDASAVPIQSSDTFSALRC